MVLFAHRQIVKYFALLSLAHISLSDSEEGAILQLACILITAQLTGERYDSSPEMPATFK